MPLILISINYDLYLKANILRELPISIIKELSHRDLLCIYLIIQMSNVNYNINRDE
jgi:hypothetical protein